MKWPPILALALVANACSSESAAPVAEGSATDPALAGALADPIMVDPQLSAQAQTDTLRAPDEPLQGAVPPGVPELPRDRIVTLGSLAKAQAESKRSTAFTGCQVSVTYGLGWSNRLPDALALPAAAKVTEAAGSEADPCRLRVVSYAIAARPEAVLALYRAIATRGAFSSSENRDDEGTTLNATRSSDGAAFFATVTAQDSGSSVDLMSNRGR